jgi:hypothetical protein
LLITVRLSLLKGVTPPLYVFVISFNSTIFFAEVAALADFAASVGAGVSVGAAFSVCAGVSVCVAFNVCAGVGDGVTFSVGAGDELTAPPSTFAPQFLQKVDPSSTLFPHSSQNAIVFSLQKI